MKLGLGTVQFGLDYGVANLSGKVAPDEINKILEYAKRTGIDTLDTASLYGSSEEVLGSFDLEAFNVVTKTVKIDKDMDRQQNFERFKESFFASQKKLGYIQLHGLMFHEAGDLLSPQGLSLWELLSYFKEKEYVQKIGASVYTPQQLEEILKLVDLDIVQLPLNILDQRFLPILPKLKKKNIEVHTRSTFLQGLLLMDTCHLNPYFEPIKHVLQKLPKNRLATSLGFVNSIKDVDKIIVGVTKLDELQQIVNEIKKDYEPINFDGLIIEDERFILPQNWRLS